MADAAMLSTPLPLRDFSLRTNPRTMRRPRTWQMFSFMRSRMRFHREVPTNLYFAVPLQLVISIYNSFPRFIEILRKLRCRLYYEIDALLEHDAKYSRILNSILP